MAPPASLLQEHQDPKKQSRTKQRRAEKNRTKHNRAEHNRTGLKRAKQNRAAIPVDATPKQTQVPCLAFRYRIIMIQEGLLPKCLACVSLHHVPLIVFLPKLKLYLKGSSCSSQWHSIKVRCHLMFAWASVHLPGQMVRPLVRPRPQPSHLYIEAPPITVPAQWWWMTCVFSYTMWSV